VTIVSANRKHDRKYFYKYTTARAAKTILVNKTVRCSSPLLFNDPCDVQRKLALGCDERELGAAVAKEVSRLVETGAPPETTSVYCKDKIPIVAKKIPQAPGGEFGLSPHK
jgi:hypothetical protein